jgi:hypothetical protein
MTTTILASGASDWACQNVPGLAGMCAAKEVAGAAGGAAKSAAGNSVLQPVVDAFNESAGHAIKWSLGLFATVSPDVTGSTNGIDAVRNSLTWIVAFIATACLIAVGAKMVFSRDARPVMGAFRGMALLVLVTGASIAIYNILAKAAAEFAKWVIDGAGGNDAGVAKMTHAMGTAGLGLALLFAFIAILVSLGLIATAMIRGAIAIVLLSFMPAIAAGTLLDSGLALFKRTVGWLAAAAIWPAVAGTIFAVALNTFKGAADGKAVCEALAAMMLAILALPAMMRLVTPLSAMGSGGSGALAAAGGAVFATGARMVSNHSSSTTSAPPPSDATNAATGPPGAAGASPAPSGSNGAAGVWTSPRTPATASGAAAPGGVAGGAATAGGAAGVAVQGAVILTRAVRDTAAQAVGEAEE